MRFPRSVLAFLLVGWVLVVLYPDPGMLVRSARHFLGPRIDPAAVSGLAARLPDDPRAVEAYVLDEAVPYAYDWQSFGVPWYFPTAAEVLRAGRGDCESRAVVLSSLLTAKGIPNELRMGFGHIWVEYPGKQANAIENAGVELAGTRDGRFFLDWPARFDLREEVADQLAFHWTPAPDARKALLALGLSLIPLWNVVAALAAGNGLPGRSRPAGLPLAAERRRRGWPARGRARPRAGGALAARPQRV